MILGDYMTKAHIEPAAFGAILKDFSAPLGHVLRPWQSRLRYDGKGCVAGLEENGTGVLENEVVANARGTSLWLVGLADLWTRQQWIEQTVAKVPKDNR